MLCDLPIEVLNQILDRVLPVHRITAQTPTDPEWSDYWEDHARQPKPLPSVLFVNKKLMSLSLPIFYEKATLEVQTVKSPDYILNSLERGLSLDLTIDLSIHHAFCPREHLQRVRQVYLFTGQSDAINAEGYEATLRWLIEHTAVKDVQLSRRLLTRLRKRRVDVVGAVTAMHQVDLALLRTVYIWTKHTRSFWELTRMREMTTVRGMAPPLLQMYLYQMGSDMDPVLDPRWDVKTSDSEERRIASKPVADILDLFAGQDTACRSAKSMWEDSRESGLAMNRLYQVCFVVRSP